MISLKADGMTINILKNTSQSSDERNFELLVDYVNAVKEIYDETIVHEVT